MKSKSKIIIEVKIWKYRNIEVENQGNRNLKSKLKSNPQIRVDDVERKRLESNKSSNLWQIDSVASKPQQ